MKKRSVSLLFLPAVLLPVFGCAQIQESVASVEEAVGGTGAVLTSASMKKSEPSAVADRRFDQLTDIYFYAAFNLNPNRATRAGFHNYDDKVGVYEAEDFKNSLTQLHQLDNDLAAMDIHALSGTRSIDWEILASKVKGDLLDLEQIRRFENDPNFYLSMISEGAFSLSARNFAPEELRMQSLITRMKENPKILDTAKKNLKNPPRVFTEIAIDQTDGAIRFFQNELGQAFGNKLSAPLKASFDDANQRTIEALRSYRDWLEKDLLPNSRGHFAIGAELFRKKLLYDEMVDSSIESLLAKGEEELARLQARAKALANQIHPGASVETVVAELAKNHPTAAQLIEKTTGGLEEIRNFCIQKNIVRFPSDKQPIVRETPPFRRSLSFASMDSPGAFETNATEAYYSVTLPPSDWPEAKQEELLRFFSQQSLPIVSIHEVYPGHYTQFLWVKDASSKIRKLIGCGSNAEGWAHYAEEMLLDEGYGGNDPKLRLAQTQMALVRACRYLAGIKLHARNMTIVEATNLFMDSAYMDRANAEREARRGTADPTYLVYTLGKKMILKLREDYKQVRGSDYSLSEFHNAFLACGYPPIPIVRKLLMPGDKNVGL